MSRPRTFWFWSFSGSVVPELGHSRTRSFPDSVIPGLGLSRTRPFPGSVIPGLGRSRARSFPDWVIPGLGHSRTRSFPDSVVPGLGRSRARSFPGSIVLELGHSWVQCTLNTEHTKIKCVAKSTSCRTFYVSHFLCVALIAFSAAWYITTSEERKKCDK